MLVLFWVCLIATSGAVPATSGAQSVWNIVYLGDSITEGAHLGRGTPPDACTDELRKELAHAEIYMANDGHSGHTTVDFLPSAGTDFPQAERDARSLQQAHPGRLIFSIMLGTNDSAQYGPNGSPVDPAAFRQNLQVILGRLLADFPGSLVVLQQPTWYSPNTANTSEYAAAGLHRLQSYFELLPDTAAAFPGSVFVGDTHAYGLFEKRYRQLLIPEKGRHGVFYLHPNARGAKLLGSAWAVAIRAHLGDGPHR